MFSVLMFWKRYYLNQICPLLNGNDEKPYLAMIRNWLRTKKLVQFFTSLLFRIVYLYLIELYYLVLIWNSFIDNTIPTFIFGSSLVFWPGFCPWNTIFGYWLRLLHLRVSSASWFCGCFGKLLNITSLAVKMRLYVMRDLSMGLLLLEYASALFQCFPLVLQWFPFWRAQRDNKFCFLEKVILLKQIKNAKK